MPFQSDLIRSLLKSVPLICERGLSRRLYSLRRIQFREYKFDPAALAWNENQLVLVFFAKRKFPVTFGSSMSEDQRENYPQITQITQISFEHSQ